MVLLETVLLILFLAVGIIMCGILRCIFEKEEKYATWVQILSYLTVIVIWPIIILISIGGWLYDTIEKSNKSS